MGYIEYNNSTIMTNTTYKRKSQDVHIVKSVSRFFKIKGEYELMNILTETFIDQKKAKKNFRKHAFLKAKILETRSITIQKKSYRLIGQQLLSSPFFSHFEVVDEEGVRGNHSVEEKIYRYISMLQITNHFRQIIPWLKEQSSYMENYNITSELEFIAEPVRQSVQNIVHESSEILQLYNDFDEKLLALFKDTDWTEKQFKELEPSWNAFWEKYEKRSTQLFNVHTTIVDQHLMKRNERNWLSSLYKEAHFTMHFFKETIPLHTPFVTDIHDFIALNGQLGKITDPSVGKELIQKKERFSFHFFKTMLYTLILIQIIVSVLTFIDVLPLAAVITTFVLVLLFFYFGYVNDRELLQTIETRLKVYRRQQLMDLPLIRKKYKKEFTTYIQAENRRKRSGKPYQFYVSIAKVPAWIMVFGIATFLIGLALIRIDKGASALPLGYVVVGLVLIIIAAYLPKMAIGKRKIILEHGKLTIQRKVYKPGDLSKVRMNHSQKQLFIHVTSVPDPMKYHVEKENRNDVHTHILKWCEQNYVSCEVKG